MKNLVETIEGMNRVEGVFVEGKVLKVSTNFKPNFNTVAQMSFKKEIEFNFNVVVSLVVESDKVFFIVK